MMSQVIQPWNSVDDRRFELLRIVQEGRAWFIDQADAGEEGIDAEDMLRWMTDSLSAMVHGKFYNAPPRRGMAEADIASYSNVPGWREVQRKLGMAIDPTLDRDSDAGN